MINLKSLQSALGQAMQSAASTAKSIGGAVAAEVVGARCLLDYNVEAQVASGGPCSLWKIYTARSKKEGERLLI